MLRFAMLGALMLTPALEAQTTRSGLKDADGKAIPEFVSKLPFPGDKPDGYLELDDFNARANQLVGTKAVVDGMLRGEAWWSDGPAVAITDTRGALPSNFDFVVDSDMQSAARKLTANTFGTTLPVRLTGTVRNSAKAQWKIFVIDEMSLLGPNGDAVWTTKRTKAHDSSIPRGTTSPTPAGPRFNPGSSMARAPRGNFQQPAVVTDDSSNAAQDPAGAAGTAAWVVFAILAAVFLAIVFAIFVVVYFVMKAKDRSRDEYDDDDEDDDDDDRPRRRRRRSEDRD